MEERERERGKGEEKEGKKRGRERKGETREKEGKRRERITLYLIHTQLETLKYSVDRAGTDLDKARSESTHLTHQIKDNRRKWVTNSEGDSKGGNLRGV